MKRTVVSLLGTTLDAGRGHGRWRKWRPTVSIFQEDDATKVDRLVLLYGERWTEVAAVVTEDIQKLSPWTYVEPVRLDLDDPWDLEEVYEKLHAFVRDLDIDPDEEEVLVHLTTGSHVAQICWFLLVETGFIPGRLLQTAPPRGGTLKHQIIDLDLARYDRIAVRFAEQVTEAQSVLKAGIDTASPSFNRMIEQVERVAVRSDAPMLIMGPTGAGKSHLARQIYALKAQRKQVGGKLVEVNCATLRGDGAMSSLFGHTRGAFTGAVADRAGLLREADGGLLFLDEIGELGLDEQAMLLRAIEQKRFWPVGSDREVESHFQLIAGTNRPLRRAVQEGRFREDLLARIDTWTFTLPGLAERREDIGPNVDVELERFAVRTGRRVRFSREARTRYLTFATGEAVWTSNFRDLTASVMRLCTLADGGRITVADVDEELDRLRAAWAPVSESHDMVRDVMGSLADELDRFDRVQLNEVLTVCAQSASLSAAGRVLFAESRKRKTSSNDADRLRKYLARFGLEFADVG